MDMSCFHILATLNNAAMNVGMPITIQVLGIYPEVELLDHMVIPCNFFEESP